VLYDPETGIYPNGGLVSVSAHILSEIKEHRTCFTFYQHPEFLRPLNLYPPIVYSSCPCNQFDAVRRRLGVPGRQPLPLAVAALERRLIRMGRLVGHTNSESIDYEAKRRGGYDRIKFELGISLARIEMFDGPESPFFCEGTTKQEPSPPKTDIWSPLGGPVPYPPFISPSRAIWNIDPRTNAIGAVFYPLVEKPMMSIIDPTDRVARATRVIAKGSNNTTRAQTIVAKKRAIRNCVTRALDTSRNDARTRRHLLRAQLKCDVQVCPRLPLRELLGRNLHSSILTFGPHRLNRVSARMDDVRRTGAFDTGGGTSEIQVAMVMEALHGAECPVNTWDVYDDGDNAILFAPLDLINAYSAIVDDFAQAIGLVLEWDPVALTDEEIIFCRAHLLVVGSSHLLVRNPTRAFSHFFSCDLQLPEGQLLPYLKTVAIGESIANLGVPVLGPIFAHIARALRDVQYYRGPPKLLARRKEFWDSERAASWRRNPVPSDASRTSFEAAFGITPDAQLAMEAAAATFNWRYTLSSSPPFPSPVDAFGYPYLDGAWPAHLQYAGASTLA
jgi:hypothetical protein